MKRIFLPSIILSVALIGTPFAQETDDAEVGATTEAAAVTDADNPGIGLLDQATEAKLRASTVLDISRVITLCQSAKKAGLSGDNLKYCNQLLASSQLQRGLFFAQSLLGQQNVRPGDVQELRRKALADLEEAVAVIKDQPIAYMRIAELNLLPDGNKDAAKEALKLVIQTSKDEQAFQFQAVRLLADLEPEPEKRAVVLATAAKSGNPQIVLLHALTLFELKRNKEAVDILQKIVEDESGNMELHLHALALLSEFREFKPAMSILDSLRAKETDGTRQHSIDMMRARIFVRMEQNDEALKLLNTLNTKARSDVMLAIPTLLLRADVHMLMDNVDEALKDVVTAERMQPDDIAVLEQKYSILVDMEKYADALAVAKKLQSLDEKPLQLVREILMLIELEKFDEAIAVAKELQIKHSEESQWVGIFIEIYNKQKSYDKALALVEEQLKEEPDELRWIAIKAQIFAGQEEWNKAVNWLESCIQKDPDSQRLALLLISVFADQKDYKSAKERIKPLLAKQPDDAVLLRLDSQLSISLGFHSEAIKTLTKVIEADPEDYTSINNLAWLLCTSPMDSVRNGRRAVELAERAGKITQYKRAFILSTLAAAYAEAGDFDKAREWSQKSVEVAKKERGKTEEERKELLEHLQKEWDCFKQDQPFRELLDESKK